MVVLSVWVVWWCWNFDAMLVQQVLQLSQIVPESTDDTIAVFDFGFASGVLCFEYSDSFDCVLPLRVLLSVDHLPCSGWAGEDDRADYSDDGAEDSGDC
jgi:hypothetical protein